MLRRPDHVQAPGNGGNASRTVYLGNLANGSPGTVLLPSARSADQSDVKRGESLLTGVHDPFAARQQSSGEGTEQVARESDSEGLFFASDVATVASGSTASSPRAFSYFGLPPTWGLSVTHGSASPTPAAIIPSDTRQRVPTVNAGGEASVSSPEVMTLMMDEVSGLRAQLAEILGNQQTGGLSKSLRRTTEVAQDEVRRSSSQSDARSRIEVVHHRIRT